ncbi:MAG: YggS family pyridoxal phosphate-dependent enzyme [Eubacteriales bacterium]|nr:YggS family pyridoxal phosphate-dependent enzyme [Eubacteriales bacterium]
MTQEHAELSARLAKWRRRLDEARPGVEICAATKMQSPEQINPLLELGVRRIGENRVQELCEKADRLNPAFRVDIIGHLQTNKVKYIVGHVDRVQSVDSPELAQALSARFSAAGRNLGVLVQVNIAQERQKHGVCESSLMPLAELVASLPGLRLEGLMAIMPIAPDPEELRPLFRRMRLWYERLQQESFGEHVDTLSMGMSGDCLVAAQEGATMVRLGTALFGARPRPAPQE